MTDAKPEYEPNNPTACACPPGLRSRVGDINVWDVALLKYPSDFSEWGEGAFKVWRECGWQTWRVLRIFDVRTGPQMLYAGRVEAKRVEPRTGQAEERR